MPMRSRKSRPTYAKNSGESGAGRWPSAEHFKSRHRVAIVITPSRPVATASAPPALRRHVRDLRLERWFSALQVDRPNLAGRASFALNDFSFQRHSIPVSSLIRYLGYGSDMNRGIFEIRRGIHILQALPAVLANYRICFNLAIGRGERGVANLELHDGVRLWGVQHYERTGRAPRPHGGRSLGQIPSDSSPASSSMAVNKSRHSRTSQTGSVPGASPLRVTWPC